jgi:hypothetical protein
VIAALLAVTLTAAPPDLTLDEAAASRFVQLALKCVGREYPNKLDHVMNDASEVQSPRALHPSFYGCFDWHSAVHGYWMMARLLHRFPALPEAARIRAALDESLQPANIAVEVAYWKKPNRKNFERTYGWAWLLKLSAELKSFPEAKRWDAALQPLADTVVEALHAFLPKQTYAIRTGVHPNTAFSLSLIRDYARAAKDDQLAALVDERALNYFGKDRDAPLRWEPGGEDFLSPSLEEAALMSKVLPHKDYARWARGFFPGLLKSGKLETAVVSDRTDPKIVHLDGLNLSRARALYTIGAALGDKRLTALGDKHARATLPHIASGSYEGEHWLATFAVQMLDAR